GGGAGGAEGGEWIGTDAGGGGLIVEKPAHLQTAAEALAAAPHVAHVWMIEDPAGAQGEDGSGLAVPGHPVPVEPLSALAAAGTGVGDDEGDNRPRSPHTADPRATTHTSATTARAQ